MERSPFWLALLLSTSWLLANPLAPEVRGQEEDAAAPAEDPFAPGAADAAPAESDPEARKVALKHWEDYIHYLRVANLELAQAAGQALLQLNISDADLLAVVDELAPYRDYDKTLVTAQKIESMGNQVSELAQRVERRIQDARLNLAREGARIRRSIQALDDGLRARLNALTRLRKAGEYAAPHMLAVLLSDRDEDRVLRPYVIEAMVEVGRPLVGPLCEALSQLPPVPKQQVAQVLARISYPMALPFLKAETIRPDIDVDTRQVLQVAFNLIIQRSNVPADTDAPTLFLMLGEDYYNNRESLVLEPQAPFNLLWSYAADVGLTYQEIPTQVFHDVMAMRSARRSLVLNPNYAASLSLWIAANFRRENNLGEQQDPSYGPEMRSPHYYATLGGPTHVQPVLFRALSDTDAELALDAIRALAATATTAERIGQDIQPLIAAMSYPDRRVRFEAAFALARSLPRIDFSGAQRVVPVLAEATRETAKPYALVLAPSLEVIRDTAALLPQDPGFSTIFGDSMDAAVNEVASIPGVDVIVINLPPAQAEGAVAAARIHAKLMSTPIVVLAPADRVPSVTQAMSIHPNVKVTSVAAEPTQVASAIEQALGSSQGRALQEQQALDYAVTALNVLLDIAIEGGEVYRVDDAQPALVAALADPRDPVVLGAAAVLARLRAASAQQPIAEAALDAARSEEVRIDLLRTLADSARIHGNMLSDGQLQLLLKLVKESQGELADAAAEAHGALDLPTSDAVELITQ